MSLSTLPEQWSLKDKYGNPPPQNIVEFIKKLDKKNLLPCPRSADELQMPEKGTVPREMNSFIVFRRQLAHVAKLHKTSDDGRVISTAASFIWNGASKNEKKSYSLIAQELKRRHREKYPNYTYERRKRKTAEEDFIVYDAGLITQNKSKKKRKASPESRAVVQHVSEEQKSVPTSTILQEQENRNWFNTSQVDNSLCYFYDNNCYSSENYCEQAPQALSDEFIPQLLQTVTSTNYTENVLARQPHMQDLFIFQQPPLTSIPSWECDSFYYGSSDVGINQPIFEGLRQDDGTLSTIFYDQFL
ncbi:hypothetical protein C1646_722015 [Rhizophagus diaphanus]|nr:hypothetical protein C1646_722015 [Rhizophagus diaphanus] [Rhizophagus sp. MUCL 43196]